MERLCRVEVQGARRHQENAPLAIWWVWREFPPTWPILDQIALIALIALLWIPPPNCLQLAGNLDCFARNLPHIPDQILLVFPYSHIQLQ
jgi:hypothetical protein